MSARQARFEVVRSDAGWFARFVAANGAKVWQTEVYARRRAAKRAVDLLAGSVLEDVFLENPEALVALPEVRDVDERGQAPATVPPYTTTTSTFVFDPTAYTTTWKGLTP